MLKISLWIEGWVNSVFLQDPDMSLLDGDFIPGANVDSKDVAAFAVEKTKHDSSVDAHEQVRSDSSSFKFLGL